MGAAAAVAGIGAVAGLAGGIMQSKAVSKGQDRAIAAQQGAEERARADLAPYNLQGQNALMLAGNLSGANGPQAATTAMQDFTTSPGYQWRMDEGMRAVDASAAAQGMLRSGATLKGEQAFAQGLASSEFDNYYRRLAGLAQLGSNAAAGTGSAAINTGAGIAGTEASGAGAQASIYGNMAQGLGNAGINYINATQYQNHPNALGPRQPYSNVGPWGPTPQYGTLNGQGTY